MTSCRTILSVEPQKVINTGNSIDYDCFSSIVYSRQTTRRKIGISQEALVFAAAGRLVPTKGQQYLIRAFAQIREKLNNAELLIAGTGELKDELQKLAFELGCGSSIHFIGHIDNMPEFYAAIDIFVLPSIAEGLPRTLIEAMASGVLCIATDAGGIPEIFNKGSCGLLVPPKDVNALADAMLKAANMPQQEKSAVISAAKEYIKKEYSHSVMIKRIEKIYDTLVAEKIG